MKPQTPWWVWLLPLPLVWRAALLVAGAWQPGQTLLYQLEGISVAFANPWAIHWCSQSRRFLLLFTLGYAVAALVISTDHKNRRRGEEHGSACWGNVYQLAKRYREKSQAANIIMTRHFRLGLDSRRHRRNLNVLVLGGSGAGKSRSYAIPNAMQCNCSFVLTDPKGGATRS